MSEEIKEEKKPYSEGHYAYHDGHKLRENPYKRFTEDWYQWKQGWEDEKNDVPYWEKYKDNKK